MVRELTTANRLLLTGTPLQNNLHELWALLNFMLPDVFQSADQFDEWFNLDVDSDDAKTTMISQLHKILRPFMLRRVKKDVAKSIPPKTETVLFSPLSAVQRKVYKQCLQRDINVVNGKASTRSAVLNIVMQLRKCCNHPYVNEDAAAAAAPLSCHTATTTAPRAVYYGLPTTTLLLSYSATLLLCCYCYYYYN